MSLLIHVSQPNGASLPLEVPPDASVGAVKLRLQSSLHCSPQLQRILVQGREMQDSQKLADIGVRHGSTVQLLLKLSGAGAMQQAVPLPAAAPVSSLVPTSTAPAPPAASTSRSAHSSAMTATDIAILNEHEKRGRWVEAVEMLSDAIQRPHSDAEDSDDSSSMDTSASPDPLPSALPSSASLLPLLLRRARCYSRLNEWNACMRDCDAVLKEQAEDVEANTMRVHCMLGLKQYDEAQARVYRLMRASHPSAALSYASLQRLCCQLRRERSGTYDMAALVEECLGLVTPSRDGYVLGGLRSQRRYPCVRLGPHADYLHPAVECAVPIPDKGRGTRVRAAGGSAAAATPTAAAASSSASRDSLPCHTLVMSMKAVAVDLHSDIEMRSDMLMRRLMDQPHLAEQVRRLFGEPGLEKKRAQLLAHTGAAATWRQPASQPSAAVLVDRSRLVATLRCNPFGDALGALWEDRGVGGGGLWFLPSFFNHSCVPNCTWTMVGDQMFVRTQREVAPGEELTIAYWPVADLRCSQRQAKLSSVWHFTCSCAYCQLYSRFPQLEQREQRLLDKCAHEEDQFDQLHWTYDTLASRSKPRPAIAAARFSELAKCCQRVQTAIDAHQRHLRNLVTHIDSSPLRLPLLSALDHLLFMLGCWLDVAPASHAEFPSMLAHHLRACMEHADIARRWKEADDVAWRSGLMRALGAQIRHPQHASVASTEQARMMREYMQQYAAAHGDRTHRPMLRQLRTELEQHHLLPLFSQCQQEMEAERMQE